MGLGVGVTAGVLLFNVIVMYNVVLREDYISAGEEENFSSDDEARDTSLLIVDTLSTPEAKAGLLAAFLRHNPHPLGGDCNSDDPCQMDLPSTDVRVWAIGVRSVSDIEKALGEVDRHHTVILNLVESVDGLSSKHPDATDAFDKMGFAYTGPNSTALKIAVNKGLAKEKFLENHLSTPLGQTFYSHTDPISLPLPPESPPLIVKPLAEDASIGISKHASIVKTEQQLRDRVLFMQDVYKTPSLVEQFIDGREFTVSVWEAGDGVTEGAVALPLVEYLFGLIDDPYMRIYDFETKWDESSPFFKEFDLSCPAILDEPTAKLVADAAVGAFKAVGMRDFARVDVRFKDGTAYVLEVVCITYPPSYNKYLLTL
ncbi:D-alanine--D-alanine ligase [Pelomyxa schiedti]|nr:D-alanine--D-alanine ligase [Pelomyxa schiedti]